MTTAKEIVQDAKSQMEKSLHALKTELSKLRTGRAHPSLLEHVKVKYYDRETPLSQVAAIAVENARTLTVTPWDKNVVGAIEKAIQTSDLGLNPVTAGMVIRVPLPVLTEDRRKGLVRLVGEEAEKMRVAIRNIRRDANNGLKQLLKAKAISEDEERRVQNDIQKLTDQHIGAIDKTAEQKEADLLSV